MVRAEIEWSSDRATRRVARTPNTTNRSAVIHAIPRGRTAIEWTSPKADPPTSAESATALSKIDSIQLPGRTRGKAGIGAGVALSALSSSTLFIRVLSDDSSLKTTNALLPRSPLLDV
jgi:hypothetical protein